MPRNFELLPPALFQHPESSLVLEQVAVSFALEPYFRPNYLGTWFEGGAPPCQKAAPVADDHSELAKKVLTRNK